MASKKEGISAQRKLIGKDISKYTPIYLLVKLFVFLLEGVHHHVGAGAGYAVVVLQVAHLLGKFLQFLVVLLIFETVGLGKIKGEIELPYSS